jgi:hypothetical protein
MALNVLSAADDQRFGKSTINDFGLDGFFAADLEMTCNQNNRGRSS